MFIRGPGYAWRLLACRQPVSDLIHRPGRSGFQHLARQRRKTIRGLHLRVSWCVVRASPSSLPSHLVYTHQMVSFLSFHHLASLLHNIFSAMNLAQQVLPVASASETVPRRTLFVPLKLLAAVQPLEF